MSVDRLEGVICDDVLTQNDAVGVRADWTTARRAIDTGETPVPPRRLRTLLIVLALGPVALWACWALRPSSEPETLPPGYNGPVDDIQYTSPDSSKDSCISPLASG